MNEPIIQTPKGTEGEEGKETPQIPPTPAPVTPPEPTVPPAPTPTVPEVDYKKKFSASTAENQRIMGELNSLNKLLGDITKVEIPTDQEMAKLYASWDTLGDFERDLAKKQIVLERRQNHITVGLGKITSNVEKTNEVNEFIRGNTSLKGKEDAFLEYALSPDKSNTPLSILLNSFLFENKETPPAPTVPPTPAPSPLQRGNPGGTGTPPTDATTMSDDEAEALSKSNPKLYMEMVRDGRIK